MIRYEIIDLPEITIIGKEGLCTKEKNVVQALWQQANAHFNEIADLGMKNPDGSFVGFWGAMSDETMSFLPWTDNFSRGLYLAGSGWMGKVGYTSQKISCDRCYSGNLWKDV